MAGGPPSISREECERRIAVIEECLSEGFVLGVNGSKKSAIIEACRRLGDVSRSTLHESLNRARNLYGLHINPDLIIAAEPPPPTQEPFYFEDIASDGEIDAPELIEALKVKSAQRIANDAAKTLYQANVNIEGPIGIALIGDPHVDSPGCDWVALQRDVHLCRDTEGVIAINLGDTSDNWVGRLAKLFANSDVTARQTLKLIEWMLTSVPWLLTIGGNHDCHDMETEALTRRGWVAGADIRDEDQILSLGSDGNAVWTGIYERIERDNFEEMVSIDRAAMNINVTPGHRVLHRPRGSANGWGPHLKYTRADALPPKFAIPVSAPSGLPEHPLPDSWIELTGWFLTDGGVQWAGRSPKVTFYQSKPAPALDAALEECGFSPAVRTRYRTTAEICGKALKAEPLPSREYVLNAEQSRRFMAVAQAKGAMPTWVWSLSDRQFEILLRAIIAGDGAWASGGGVAAVVHGTKTFLSSLQAACVAHGWSAHLSVARQKDWRLNVCPRREWQAHRSAVITRSAAARRVWCLRVPNGNFMVRRRGKVHFSGNCWHTDTADPIDIIHRMAEMPGLYQHHGARIALNLPGGHQVIIHARHDFPGRSQFNATHPMVRETLFGFRDHILAGGHRHQAGYQPIWHNDPPRLCHGFQVGSYKVVDDYAREKHFRRENWTPAMMAVIDPDYAHDTRRFILRCFTIEEGVDTLRWRRSEWKRRHAL